MNPMFCCANVIKGRKRALCLVFLLSVSMYYGAVTASSEDYLTPLWEFDVRELSYNVYVLDLNNDSLMETVADASIAGLVYGIDYSGKMLWKHSIPGIIFDTYAAKIGNKGITVAGSWNRVYVVEGNDEAYWSYFLEHNDVKSVYVDDLNNDGLYEFAAGVISGGRGNLVYVINSSRNEMARYHIPASEYPSKIYAMDMDGDGIKEIVIGTVRYSPNTLFNRIDPVYGKESDILVYDLNGNLQWKAETCGGAVHLSSADLDEDGNSELIVGSKPCVQVFNRDGTSRWNYTTGGSVTDSATADLNKDGSPEFILASNGIYALDYKGERLWKYSASGNVTSVKVVDLDKDGYPEIIASSSVISILDKDGKLKWSSSSYAQINDLKVGDLDNDGFMEVVVGAKDHTVKAFTTKTYVKKQQAKNQYDKAQEAYGSRDYPQAEELALKSKEYYQSLGDSAGITASQSLIEKAREHVKADGYYNQSMEAYSVGDYQSTVDYAQKAVEIYRVIQDLAALSEANSIMTNAARSSQAYSYLSDARDAYASGDYVNASSLAASASEAFNLSGDEENMLASEELVNKSELHMKADEYMSLAEKYFVSGNSENATVLLTDARGVYVLLQDNASLSKADSLLRRINDARNREKWFRYMLVILAAAIILGLVSFVAVVYVYLKRSKENGGKNSGIGYRPPPPRRRKRLI